MTNYVNCFVVIILRIVGLSEGENIEYLKKYTSSDFTIDRIEIDPLTGNT